MSNYFVELRQLRVRHDDYKLSWIFIPRVS
jgi:hypothetical protein